jgi:hypothetical protein
VALDPVARGISCSLAQSTVRIWIKVGNGQNFVIEGGHTVTDGTGSGA